MARTLFKQANFLLPLSLWQELKGLSSRREMSLVVREALEREMKRRRLAQAIQNTFGAWKHQPHPELRGGSTAFIRKLRKGRK